MIQKVGHLVISTVEGTSHVVWWKVRKNILDDQLSEKVDHLVISIDDYYIAKELQWGTTSTGQRWDG